MIGAVGVGTGVDVKVVAGTNKLKLGLVTAGAGKAEEREAGIENGKLVLVDADALELVPVAKTVVGIQFVPRSNLVETDVVVTVTVTVAPPDAAGTAVLVGPRVKSETRVTRETVEVARGAIVEMTRGAEEVMGGEDDGSTLVEEATEDTEEVGLDAREIAGGTRSKAWRR